MSWPLIGAEKIPFSKKVVSLRKQEALCLKYTPSLPKELELKIPSSGAQFKGMPRNSVI